MRLDEIRKETLDRFVATKLKTPKQGRTIAKTLSAKRVKNIVGTLHRILTSALEWEVIQTVPRFPRVKVPESRVAFFTREE
jgi:hypothetical protein